MDITRSVALGAYCHVGDINWDLRREHGVHGTPGKAYTISVSNQHLLYTIAFYTMCVTPAGQVLLLLRHSVNTSIAEDERLATSLNR